MHDVDSNQAGTQRRRTERVSGSVPLIVRGIDLLGQPFEERTSTLALNLNGCRYSSKHHLPKNTWVTLEIPQGGQRRNVRARVAWIQRPHSVREFFQIAVELETPANIWGVEDPPADWQLQETTSAAVEQNAHQPFARSPEESGASAIAETTETFAERVGPDMTNPLFESAAAVPFVASSLAEQESGAAESPLLREWKAEIERQASRAAEAASAQAAEQASARATEQIRQTMDEIEQAQRAARGAFSSELAAKQEEILGRAEDSVRAGRFPRRASWFTNWTSRAQALRAESEAAAESTSRMAQARVQIDAAEASRSQQESADTSQKPICVD